MTEDEALARALERERRFRRRWLDEIDELTLELRSLQGSAPAQEAERLRELAESARRELARERAARLAVEEHVLAIHAEIATGTAPRLAPGRESEAVNHFVERYARLLANAGLKGLGQQELGLPSPRLPRTAVEEPDVSVVICIRDALDDVRRCLASIGRWTTGAYEVVLVDDGSGPATAALLARVAAKSDRVGLISNPDPPHGYTIAANLGVAAARGRWIVLLNSDTIVSPGWLDRIVACGESDERIGVVGPVSNAATHQSVPAVREQGQWATNPLPSWLTVDGMAAAVASVAGSEVPRVPFLNGFCYVIRRSAVDAVGRFDEERFAAGYCEENDFSMRAAQAGFELAIAADAFVYHAKSRSYTPAGRNEHARRNYAAFRDKHGPEVVDRLVAELEAAAPMAGVGARLDEALRDPPAYVDAVQARLGRQLRPVYVLPGIAAGGSGGSHSIVQEAAGLRRLGVGARIAVPAEVLDRAHAVYPGQEELFLPFASAADLAAAEMDVVIATHFRSIAIVRQLLEQRPDVVPGYYVQDYEPFFVAPGSSEAREAERSYGAIPGVVLFAKTDWLCTVVGAAHDLPIAKVEPSLDHAVYRPDDGPRDDVALVCAMVRPRTPRRRPAATVQLLERLHRALDGRVRIATFGCERRELEQLTADRAVLDGHRGILRRDEVAELLGAADVFVDMSVYQAFGRTALEAMACGCVPVVPERGGVWEFASPGENAMVVDTLDHERTLEATAGLLCDPAQRTGMRARAIETAARYSIERSSLSVFAVLAGAVLRQDAERKRRSAARSAARGSAAQMLSQYDFGAEELAASSVVLDAFARRRPRQEPLERVTWFIPAFDHIYRGGVHTALRLADALQAREGCHAQIVLCGDGRTGELDATEAQIRGAFPNLHLSLHRADRPEATALPPSDAAVCTHWTTAYHLLRYNACDAKYYLVQDFEPAFAPADVVYGLAEATYRFGFLGLANTVGVAEAYAGYGNEVLTFAPGVDRTLFHAAEAPSEPVRVVFYARPRRPRNGFELGRLALTNVKRRHGDAVDIVLAGADFDVRDVGLEGIARNAGLLEDLSAVAKLYRESHIGLAFMFTRHPSYQPLEYMASGCVTVTNVNAATGWLLRHDENCLAVEPSVTSVTDAVNRLIEDPGSRARLREGGLRTAATMDWDAAVAPVVDYLARGCRPSR